MEKRKANQKVDFDLCWQRLKVTKLLRRLRRFKLYFDFLSVDRLANLPHSVVISCYMKLNLDYLLDALWEHLNMVRVYTKKPGCKPDFEEPVILRSGANVKHVCHTIHRTLPNVFKYALVWVRPILIYFKYSFHPETSSVKRVA